MDALTDFPQQLAFLAEIDKLKGVLRQAELIDGTRRENSAEHSWHIATMALVLHPYAAEPVDMHRVLKMVLVHDIVEIDAGDTFAFDAAAHLDKEEREKAAAARLFGLLPAPQNQELLAVWQEFEHNDTPEARFANALDRMAGLVSNTHNRGGTWRRFGIAREAVLRRMAPIEVGMPGLWPQVLQMVEQGVADGFILP